MKNLSKVIRYLTNESTEQQVTEKTIFSLN